MQQQPASVLIICTRRIGDVLLTTPLVRSIRLAWPKADIDILVFAGTQAILKHNPDLRHVLMVPERPTLSEHLRLAKQLYRRYDLAISTMTGDRPTIYAWLAGRNRIGFIDPGRPSRFKQRMLHASLPFDNLNTHTVRMNLQLTKLLGINPVADVVVQPANEGKQIHLPGINLGETPYAVLHPYPRFTYKQWHEDGWVAVAKWLSNKGVRTVLTGGAAEEEQQYVSALALKMPLQTINLAGKISLSDTATVIQGAVAYVGPDTATTHMAAALGIPTIALFGPSNPVKWAPWPKGWTVQQNPFGMHGVQQRGNVTLLQGSGACVPCMKEGCQWNTLSTSDCLMAIPPQKVIHVLDTLLNSGLLRGYDDHGRTE